jgi:hypothetical protein
MHARAINRGKTGVEPWKHLVFEIMQEQNGQRQMELLIELAEHLHSLDRLLLEIAGEQAHQGRQYTNSNPVRFN